MNDPIIEQFNNVLRKHFESKVKTITDGQIQDAILKYIPNVDREHDASIDNDIKIERIDERIEVHYWINKTPYSITFYR